MSKPNPGWFKKGFDSRRHVFSFAELRKGFLHATRLAKLSSRTKAWLRSKIRNHYRGRKGG